MEVYSNLSSLNISNSAAIVFHHLSYLKNKIRVLFDPIITPSEIQRKKLEKINDNIFINSEFEISTFFKKVESRTYNSSFFNRLFFIGHDFIYFNSSHSCELSIHEMQNKIKLNFK